MNNFTLERQLKKAKKMTLLGDVDNARIIYKDILQVYPSNVRAKENLSKIYNENNLVVSELDEKNIEKKAFKLFKSNFIDELYNFVNKYLKNYPNNLVLLNFKGVSEAKKDKFFVAYDTFKKILEIDPKNVDALNSIGLLLNEAKRYPEAISYLEKAGKIQSKNSSIYNNLGISYGSQNKYEEAKKNFLQAIAIDKSYDAKRNLSTLLVSQAVELGNRGHHQHSVNLFLEAKSFFPKNPDIFAGLGPCYCKLGEIEKAESIYLEGLNIGIGSFDFFYNLSSFYAFYKRDGHKALEFAYKALEISPNNEKMLNNLSIFYSSILKDDLRSMNVLKKAVGLYPNSSKILGNLATLYQKNGFHKNAKLLYLKSLSINPSDKIVFSNYLFSISLMSGLRPDEVFKEHLKFGNIFNNPPKMFKYYNGLKKAERKIRLGFVSGDFKEHAIKTVLLPFFQKLDKSKFEIYTYSNSFYEDAVTQEYKIYSDNWNNCTSIGDYELAQQIWNDKVDILFDMAGHSQGNRLISFSFKPAPIQISWMGYPITTGLSAIDYTIYDQYFAPNTADEFFVEKILRLPNHFQFIKPQNLEENRPQKKRQFNEIIFASFNHSRKLNEDVIKLWCQILNKVKNSKIVIGNLEKLSLDWIGNIFLQNGIDKSRINLIEPLNLNEYLELHKKIDILLDTWPYSGGTTTAYALMYGIPVVTLAGETVAQNQSLGILKNIGIEDSIADTESSYVTKAIELASDTDRLYQIKLENFQKYKAFTEQKQNNTYTHLEKLLINLWNEYCEIND